MTERELADFTNRQLKNMLISDEDVTPFVKEALEKTLSCFEPNKNKYYSERNRSVFHSGHYATYLYYLSNTVYKAMGDADLTSKIYYLNKILHAVDWFYAINLPNYWGVEHPLGSVLGRARYSDGLFIYQGCTVGGNKKKYPALGRNVIMYSNSTILGDCHVGDNVILGTGCTIKDEDIPSNSLVFGASPHLVIKQKSEEEIQPIIDEIWTKNRGEN